MLICWGDEYIRACMCVCVCTCACMYAAQKGLNLISHIEYIYMYVMTIPTLMMHKVNDSVWESLLWKRVQAYSSLLTHTHTRSSEYYARSRSRISSCTHIISNSIIIAHHSFTHRAFSIYEILYVNTGKLFAFIQLHSGSFYLFLISFCLPDIYLDHSFIFHSLASLFFFLLSFSLLTSSSPFTCSHNIYIYMPYCIYTLYIIIYIFALLGYRFFTIQ